MDQPLYYIEGLQYGGLTAEQRESLSARQNHICPICKRRFGKGANAHPCVDHDHKTMKVRGMVCGRCNVFLGIMDDDVAGVQRALAYLTQSEGWADGLTERPRKKMKGAEAMFYVVKRDKEQKEIYFDFEKIWKVEVAYADENEQEHSVTRTTLQRGREDPTTVRVYYIYVGNEVIGWRADPDKKLTKALQELCQNAIRD
jgi:hypothetical protein